MAHPFVSQAKSTSAAKFKSMTGKKSSGQSHPDGAQDSKAKAAMSGKNNDEYNVGGAVSAPSFARGGRSKSKGNKGTNIKIMVVAPGKDKEGPDTPPPMMPPGGAPMAPPPGMGPPGAPPGGPPPGMPPMKRGGAAYAKGGKVPMKSGAESGPGRLEKARAYGLPAIKKAN